MIIDSHCHGGAGFGLRDPWTHRPLLEKYLRRAQAAGIERTVLFANFHEDYGAANRIVAGLVEGNPRRFFGFCYVHAARDRGRIFALVRTAVEDYGFIGIKVHRHDARISREVCEAARAFALPVLYDVENELPMVDLLAREYPDVAFVIPTWEASARTGGPRPGFWTGWNAIPTSMPTAPGPGSSISCSARWTGPGRTSSCSARTGLGCIPAWNSPRSVQ